MTDELSIRAERAIAEIEAVGSFLRGTFFEAQITKAVRGAVLEAQSPYVDRAGVEGRVKTSPARMAEHNWKVFK